MGEAESFEGETFADGRATAAGRATTADNSAGATRDVGAGSADSGPPGPGAEHGDGKLATLGSGATVGDETQGAADLTAGATPRAATDSPGCAGAGEAVASS